MVAKNLQIRLASRPVGLPRDTDFEAIERPIDDPGPDQVLVRNVYLSLDPAMRGWMDDRKSYLPPIALGDVMRGLTVGEVLVSNHEDFSQGDRVQGVLGWQTHAVAKGEDLTLLPPEVPMRVSLGPLGMTGLTAYFGLLDIGEPKAGDTVLVSGAAGAVGSVVGQIAKIEGCRVVGIAGGPDKCRWVKEELGFDEVIDYKATEDLGASLRQACPKGIDIYFDNVGGSTLDEALKLLRLRARVVVCGAISQYNATEPAPGPANYLALLVQRARMEGFIVFDYRERYGEALAYLGTALRQGQLKYREDVVDGLRNAPSALLRLFDGSNTGKLLIQVGPEP